MDYGPRIKELRKYLGITSKEFGKLIGVDTSTAFQYENNTTEKAVDRICDMLHISREYFEGKIPVEDAISYSGNNHMRVERIKTMMREKGIRKNKELSLMSGVSQSRLSEIFKESCPLTIDKARKISSALCVGVDWLLYGDEGKKDYPVNEDMVEWLWQHPEIRKYLWEKKNSK